MYILELLPHVIIRHLCVAWRYVTAAKPHQSPCGCHLPKLVLNWSTPEGQAAMNCHTTYLAQMLKWYLYLSTFIQYLWHHCISTISGMHSSLVATETSRRRKIKVKSARDAIGHTWQQSSRGRIRSCYVQTRTLQRRAWRLSELICVSTSGAATVTAEGRDWTQQRQTRKAVDNVVDVGIATVRSSLMQFFVRFLITVGVLGQICYVLYRMAKVESHYRIVDVWH